MSDALRWGILGTGNITPRLVNAIAGSDRHITSAVASRDAGRAAEYAARHGIAGSHGSYEALVADAGVDVVYVALPNHLHAEWAIRALEAGKHVLCEKPLALEVEDVDRVAAAAEHAGRIAVEGFMYLHHPQTKRVIEVVRSGALGEIVAIRAAFTFALDRPGDVRLQPAMGGGSLWDVGGYPVSFSNRVVGARPSRAEALTRLGPTGVDLSAVGLLGYDAGLVAQVFSSFEVPHREQVEIVGSEATLYADPAFVPHLGGRETVIRIRRESGDELIVIPLADPYLAEADNLADAIAGRAEPELPLAETRRNLATVLDLYRSANAAGIPA
jgi:predicted dehydrogenase